MSTVGYKVWGVMQERVYSTHLLHVADLKLRLIVAWSRLQQQYVSDNAINQRYEWLRVCEN